MAATLGLQILAACSVAIPDAGPVVNRRPVNYIDVRFQNTIRQQYDFSCGAASIATLFTFYYNRPTTELQALEVLRLTYDGRDWEKAQDEGFSFADLIRAAEYMGYSGEALAIEPSELGNLAGPVIVNLDNGIFKHFVVLREVTDDIIYVSDSITGDEAMPLWLFREQYTGHALAIWREGEDLPPFSNLTNVQDGISVSNSIAAGLSQVQPRFRPIF